jgi:hypothetical protein
MKINGIDTTNIGKFNGIAKASIKKISGVTLPSLTPVALLNADASTWNVSTPTSWVDFNSNVGTLVNGTAYNSANGGNMQFDGVNDYITFPNLTGLNSQTITMESWVYLNVLNQAGFIFEKGSVNTQFSNFFYLDGNYYFRTKGLSTEDLSIASASYMTANAWYHLTCTYGAGIKTIYVNGTQVAQVTGLTGSITYNNTALFLGAYYIGGSVQFNLNGRIAISRAYASALTSAQVLNNFNAEKTRFGY